jgi:hypothetical protein
MVAALGIISAISFAFAAPAFLVMHDANTAKSNLPM